MLRLQGLPPAAAAVGGHGGFSLVAVEGCTPGSGCWVEELWALWDKNATKLLQTSARAQQPPHGCCPWPAVAATSSRCHWWSVETPVVVAVAVVAPLSSKQARQRGAAAIRHGKTLQLDVAADWLFPVNSLVAAAGSCCRWWSVETSAVVAEVVVSSGSCRKC